MKVGFLDKIRSDKRLQWAIIGGLVVLVVVMFFVCLFVGSAKLSVQDCFDALAYRSTPAYNRIIHNIRLPRVLAAIVAGAGLAVAGLIMQTCLGNVMASPATLGVSNAAVFGANVCLIALSGGFWAAGRNMGDGIAGFSPYAVSSVALVFAVLSVLLVLGLSRLGGFGPNTVVLAGIAIGAVWTAGTTFLQFFATDTGLSAAVVWSFGDLGRATFEQVYIMLGVVTAASVAFWCLSWRFNALLGGDSSARAVGVNVNLLRMIGMLVASLITAVCVSFLGVIGFVGIICPHVVKKLIGHNHVTAIPATLLTGMLLLLVADTLARTVGNGTALPVGAVTSLLGAPFFVILLLGTKERQSC